MSPSGGTRARSGTICITSPRLQNEAGKLGHAIRTLIAGPSGGKTLVSLGSRSMDKPSYRHLLFDFKFDSLSDTNPLCKNRYARVMHSGIGWLGESSLYSQILLLVLATTGSPEAYTRRRHPRPVAPDFSTKMRLTMNSLPSVII